MRIFLLNALIFITIIVSNRLRNNHTVKETKTRTTHSQMEYKKKALFGWLGAKALSSSES